MATQCNQQLSLHWLEKLVLLALNELNRPAIYEELAQKAVELVNRAQTALSRESFTTTARKPSAIAKACGWLQQKQLIEQYEHGETTRIISLGREGLRYASEGLPERRLVNFLIERGGEATVDEVSSAVNDYTIALNWAKRNGWIAFDKKNSETYVRIVSEPPSMTVAEELLQRLMLEDTIPMDSLPEEMKNIVEQMITRQDVIRIVEKRERRVGLTSKGKELASQLAAVKLEDILSEITQLTPEILKTGKWRHLTLSKYDITAAVPPVFAAKRHPLVELIRLVKQVYVEMGFEEIQGPIVELAFWNFDALFQPQDHPAREMQDTFYVDLEEKGEIPREYVDEVKKVHENGGRTGSKGWRYNWSEDEARRLVLRTHTTATTIRHLAEVKKPPIKVFSVDRIYRNEKVDWKHLAEFHQIEGIVMEKGANFRQLMGIIKEFYSRLGLREVRFRPSYFPYTEPSAEVEVFLGGKWLELGGMGVFRPETTAPFGVKYPVLAWGLGLERLAMAIYGVEDIRTFSRNDLAWLRRTSPLTPYRVAGRI
ncbi:MAG: phenylalanine--tRNA ligase subunit alpha [Aigarchaeota archaeon]|nr:phenylalanine--tRNA ligase subunit alpha [Candidatus Pelearchaeum maunauluense]